MKFVYTFLIGVFLALGLVGCDIHYSEGYRRGVVQKFSKKGFFCHTYEGELVIEGFRFKGNNVASSGTNVWKFSVRNPSVAKDLEAAMETGDPVRLSYQQLAFHNPCQASTEYDVTAVQALGH